MRAVKPCFGKAYEFLGITCWENELQVVHFMLGLLSSPFTAILFIRFMGAILRADECVL